MSSNRALFRRVSVLNGLAVICVYGYAFWISPEKIQTFDFWRWALVLIPAIFMLIGLIDVFVVYRLIRKLQPIARVSATKEAFLRGTSWTQLRGTIKRLGQALESNEWLRREALKLDPSERAEVERLIMAVEYPKAARYIRTVLKRQRNQREEAQRVAERNARNASRGQIQLEALVQEGITLGIPEASMREAICAADAAKRIARQRERMRLTQKAKTLGYLNLVSHMLSSDALEQAAVTLARVEDLMSAAKCNGIVDEVAALLAAGDLAGADRANAQAKDAADFSREIAGFETRITALPLERRAAPTSRLAVLRQTVYGTRAFRQARYQLEQILD